MSDASKAVFLSYASQDAEAAKRICDALRQVGVEVWFDQSELVGGDQWDQKIRGQISTCALFVPIISANTQARGEGYFRLEWKLAVDRSHLMAHDQPFLLPVVIDATADTAARVPPEFRTVQWTKLVGGETPPAFCTRVKKLLGGSPTDVGPVGDRPPGQRPDLQQNRTPVRTGSMLTIIGAALGIALAAYFALRPHRIPEEIAKFGENPHALASNAAVKSTPRPLTKAQQLVVQARSLYEPWRVATADDLKLAERLLKEANELEPADGEGWASLAILSSALQRFGFDRSDARRGLLISSADRASKIAPDSPYAQYALAIRYSLDRATQDDADRMLRALSEQTDAPAFVQHAALRDLAMALFGKRQTTEALAMLERAGSLRGGDPNAYFEMGSIFLSEGRFEQAVAADDRAIALRPDFGAAHAGKLVILLFGLGDLTRTRTALQQIPSRVLRDERIATLGALVWFVSDEHPKADEVLRLIPGDYLESEWAHEPKALLGGLIHERAGRNDAAVAEWKVGLRAVEQRLTSSPTDRTELGNKAKLLALLGERAQAEETLRLIEQLDQQANGRGATRGTWMIYAMLGHEAKVADYFEKSFEAGGASPWFDFSPGHLKFHPSLDAFRASPRFIALARKADLIFAARAKNDSTSGTASTRVAGDGDKSTVPDKSVAVLAFANLSDDKSNEYFSDGISEELLNVLAKVPGLKVTARTSSFHFKGMNTAIPEIAQQLGVAYVIEGSVRKQGEKVRITAQLIKAADGFHVWSDTFTRDLKDIFAVQDEIAGLIAQQLQLKLGASVRVTKVVNPEAYELLLKGRAFLSRGLPTEYPQGIQYLKDSLAIDPESVATWGRLAMGYVLAFAQNVPGWLPRDEIIRLARQAADRAIELDPEQSLGHQAQCLIAYLADWDWARADAAMQRVLALTPSDAESLGLAASLQLTAGHTALAREAARRAVLLDPLNFPPFYQLMKVDWQSGDYVELEKESKRLIVIHPRSPYGHSFLCYSLVLRGRAEEAAQVAEHVTSDSYRLTCLALAHYAQGKSSEAQAELEQLKKQFGTTSAYQVAENYAFRKDLGQAFEWLETAYRERDSGLTLITNDPFFENLRGDGRWRTFMRKMNLPEGGTK